MTSPPGPAVVRESAPKIPGFPGILSHRGERPIVGEGSTCPREGSAQLWGTGSSPGHATAPKPPPSLRSSGLPLGAPPHKPFEPPPAALSLASPGRLPGQALQGPRWAQVDPRWRAGPRPVPGVCLQVHSAPHKLVSQDFSTQNTSPREATGLMSWACGRSHPALLVPPQSRTAVRGRPGQTHWAWDGAQDPLACSSGLRDKPWGWQYPDHQHGRSPT